MKRKLNLLKSGPYFLKIFSALLSGFLGCGLILFHKKTSIYFVLIFLFIFLAISILFAFITKNKKTSEIENLEEDLILIENQKLKSNPDSRSHEFVDDICKNCGCTVSTIKYFKWWTCSAGD